MRRLRVLATTAVAAALLAPVALVSGAAGAQATSYASAVLANGPVGYWRLGETTGTTAADATTFNHPGVYGGNVTRGMTGALTGDPDGAVGFDGTNAQVSIDDGSALQLNGAFTIEFWAKQRAFVNSWPGILDKGSSWTADGYLIWYTSNGALRFKRNNVSVATPNQSLSSTAFNHFAVTYDGKAVRWYVNGAQVSSAAVTYPKNTTTAPLLLGQGDNAGAVVLDELAMYPTALSASAIATHYQAGTTSTTKAAPGAPAQVTAVPGNGKAWVAWTRPVSSGTSPISGYTVTASPGGQSATVDGTTTNVLVPALTNGTAYTFTVVAKSADGTSPASPASSPVTPTPDPMIAAAGDIACSPANPAFAGSDPTQCQMQATANLVARYAPSAVLPLGDNQYDTGSLSEFQNGYAASWGAIPSTVAQRPVPGNHEYADVTHSDTDSSATATGYFSYFGAAVANPAGTTTPSGQPGGYYSWDASGYHFVALNSQCAVVGGCGAGSPEEQWLRSDLAAHPASCTVAYFHEPRWSDGPTGSQPEYGAFWNDLYGARADVVLNGHDHGYERFAPQDPSGAATTAGVREFVVGSGGEDLAGFTSPYLATSELRNSTDFGILLLTLHASSYDWRFVNTAGLVLDSGTNACHGSPPPPPPTTTYASTVLGDNPLGYWRLGETGGTTAADATTHNHPGAYTGNLTLGMTGALARDTDTSVGFDGTNAQVSIDDGSALQLNGAFTIEFWAKQRAFVNSWPGILDKGSSWTADGYLIWYTSNGALRFKRNNVSVATPDGTLSSTAFKHFALTYDGSTVRWFVNGTQVASAAQTYPANATTAPLLLGQGDNAGAVVLDEVAVYGSALSASRVAAHYQAGI